MKMFKMKTQNSIMCFLIIVICAVMALPAGPMLQGNPLASLPSAPGSTVDAIKAMGENEWLNLGAPASDPVYGNAFGRSWGGSALVLCPDLRGAMFTGEGVHAYVKPDGFGMDDWWFYDINAHKWICVWPGTDTQNFNQQVANGDIKVDSLGRAVDVSGQPVPGHLLIHTYHWLQYDPENKKFVLFPSWSPFGKYFMPGGSAVEAGIDALNSQGMNQGGGPFGPWEYDPYTGRFSRDLAANACPLGSGSSGFPLLQYVDSKKQFFMTQASGSSWYNPATRTWSAGESGGGLSSYDFSGCYAPGHDKVYVGNSGNNFYCYDVQGENWSKITFPGSAGLSTNSGAVTYDATGDRVLVFSFNTADVIYPLNPATNTFETAIPFGSSFLSAHTGNNSVCYDPELGVHFIYTGRDSRDDGVMWVYKYRKSTTEISKAIRSQPSAVSEINIKIYNVNGRLVKKLTADSRQLKAGLPRATSGLSNGIYILKVNAAGRQFSRKLLIRK
jgi:hypothetical protein